MLAPVVAAFSIIVAAAAPTSAIPPCDWAGNKDSAPMQDTAAVAASNQSSVGVGTCRFGHQHKTATAAAVTFRHGKVCIGMKRTTVSQPHHFAGLLWKAAAVQLAGIAGGWSLRGDTQIS